MDQSHSSALGFALTCNGDSEKLDKAVRHDSLTSKKVGSGPTASEKTAERSDQQSEDYCRQVEDCQWRVQGTVVQPSGVWPSRGVQYRAQLPILISLAGVYSKSFAFVALRAMIESQ